jgi:6-phosphogluconolactonase (cycloisomerase 2 family)
MSSKSICLKWLVALPMVAGLLVCVRQPAAADDSNRAGFVYVMTNKNPGNSVVQFRRASDGSLTWVREVPTGGNGTGPNGADPLGSQDALLLSGDGHLLIAVNALSNEVSVLGVQVGKLRWLSKVPSGGTFPNSVTLHGDLVYVLNTKGTANVNGFRVDTGGVLHWLATVDLPAGSAGANDIRFSPGGDHLLVTVSGTNQILEFEVGDDGVANSPIAQPAAGATPFGIRFGHDGVAVVSEAAGSVSSYRLEDDMLNVISGAVPNGQKASCWISLTGTKRYAYVSNTASGNLSSYAVASDGQVSLLKAIAATAGGPPIDTALSGDSRFLYVQESPNGTVQIFHVDGANLIPAGQVTSLPAGIQGIAAQ